MSNADFQPMQRMSDDEINRLVSMSPQINTMAAANPAMLTRDGALTPASLESILGYGSGSTGGLGALGGSGAAASPYAMWGITDPDEVAYLDANPDVFAGMQQGLIISPRQHFQQFGQAEGRTFGAPKPVAAAAPAAPAGPAPASMYGNEPENWAAFSQAGRAGTEGINQMPGVFSNYGGIPADDAAAKAMFYAGSAQPAPDANALMAAIQAATLRK